MKSGTTFKGQAKPFGKTGHFHEPMRHSLQAKGFKTGNLSDSSLAVVPPQPKSIPTFKPTPPTKDWMGTHFKVKDNVEIVAEAKDSRDGFNHVATLFVNGQPVDSAKAHYINRTRESYEFQSVMQNLINKTKELSDEDKALAKSYLATDHTDWSGFQAISTIAKLGDVLGQNQKEKNDWKERMLKAGLGGMGLDMPEDWDTLDENTKEARLNKVIEEVGKVGNKAEQPTAPPVEHPVQLSFEKELQVQYDSKKSFYGKAKVRGDGGRVVLQSYGTDVASIENGKAIVNGTYSQTTLRHIKEFLKQNGFKAETSTQIMKDYGGK